MDVIWSHKLRLKFVIKLSDGYHSEARQEKHAAFIPFSIQMKIERSTARIFLFRAWTKAGRGA